MEPILTDLKKITKETASTLTEVELIRPENFIENERMQIFLILTFFLNALYNAIAVTTCDLQGAL